MMIPQYPKNSSLVEDWCKHFSKALFSTFQRGLKLDLDSCSSSSLSFCSIEQKEAILFIIPKPPTEDIGNLYTYKLWNSVFSRFLFDVQESGFVLTRLLENADNVKSHAVLYDIEQRYFVFKKDDVIPPLMCRVCFNKASESARIYCSNGHWFCLECCKNLLRTAKVCPICREPSSQDQYYELQKVIF